VGGSGWLALDDKSHVAYNIGYDKTTETLTQSGPLNFRKDGNYTMPDGTVKEIKDGKIQNPDGSVQYVFENGFSDITNGNVKTNYQSITVYKGSIVDITVNHEYKTIDRGWVTAEGYGFSKTEQIGSQQANFAAAGADENGNSLKGSFLVEGKDGYWHVIKNGDKLSSFIEIDRELGDFTFTKESEYKDEDKMDVWHMKSDSDAKFNTANNIPAGVSLVGSIAGDFILASDVNGSFSFQLAQNAYVTIEGQPAGAYITAGAEIKSMRADGSITFNKGSIFLPKDVKVYYKLDASEQAAVEASARNAKKTAAPGADKDSKETKPKPTVVAHEASGSYLFATQDVKDGKVVGYTFSDGNIEFTEDGKFNPIGVGSIFKTGSEIFSRKIESGELQIAGFLSDGSAVLIAANGGGAVATIGNLKSGRITEIYSDAGCIQKYSEQDFSGRKGPKKEGKDTVYDEGTILRIDYKIDYVTINGKQIGIPTDEVKSFSWKGSASYTDNGGKFSLNLNSNGTLSNNGSVTTASGKTYKITNGQVSMSVTGQTGATAMNTFTLFGKDGKIDAAAVKDFMDTALKDSAVQATTKNGQAETKKTSNNFWGEGGGEQSAYNFDWRPESQKQAEKQEKIRSRANALGIHVPLPLIDPGAVNEYIDNSKIAKELKNAFGQNLSTMLGNSSGVTKLGGTVTIENAVAPSVVLPMLGVTGINMAESNAMYNISFDAKFLDDNSFNAKALEKNPFKVNLNSASGNVFVQLPDLSGQMTSGTLNNITLTFGSQGSVVNAQYDVSFVGNANWGNWSNASDGKSQPGARPKVDTRGVYTFNDDHTVTLSGTAAQPATITFINGQPQLFGEGATALAGSRIIVPNGKAGQFNIGYKLVAGELVNHGGQWVGNENSKFVFTDPQTAKQTIIDWAKASNVGVQFNNIEFNLMSGSLPTNFWSACAAISAANYTSNNGYYDSFALTQSISFTALESGVRLPNGVQIAKGNEVIMRSFLSNDFSTVETKLFAGSTVSASADIGSMYPPNWGTSKNGVNFRGTVKNTFTKGQEISINSMLDSQGYSSIHNFNPFTFEGQTIPAGAVQIRTDALGNNFLLGNGKFTDADKKLFGVSQLEYSGLSSQGKDGLAFNVYAGAKVSLTSGGLSVIDGYMDFRSMGIKGENNKYYMVSGVKQFQNGQSRDIRNSAWELERGTDGKFDYKKVDFSKGTASDKDNVYGKSVIAVGGVMFVDGRYVKGEYEGAMGEKWSLGNKGSLNVALDGQAWTYNTDGSVVINGSKVTVQGYEAKANREAGENGRTILSGVEVGKNWIMRTDNGNIYSGRNIWDTSLTNSQVSFVCNPNGKQITSLTDGAGFIELPDGKWTKYDGIIRAGKYFTIDQKKGYETYAFNENGALERVADTKGILTTADGSKIDYSEKKGWTAGEAGTAENVGGKDKYGNDVYNLSLKVNTGKDGQVVFDAQGNVELVLADKQKRQFTYSYEQFANEYAARTLSPLEYARYQGCKAAGIAYTVPGLLSEAEYNKSPKVVDYTISSLKDITFSDNLTDSSGRSVNLSYNITSLTYNFADGNYSVKADITYDSSKDGNKGLSLYAKTNMAPPAGGGGNSPVTERNTLFEIKARIEGDYIETLKASSSGDTIKFMGSFTTTGLSQGRETSGFAFEGFKGGTNVYLMDGSYIENYNNGVIDRNNRSTTGTAITGQKLTATVNHNTRVFLKSDTEFYNLVSAISESGRLTLGSVTITNEFVSGGTQYAISGDVFGSYSWSRITEKNLYVGGITINKNGTISGTKVAAGADAMGGTYQGNGKIDYGTWHGTTDLGQGISNFAIQKNGFARAAEVAWGTCLSIGGIIYQIPRAIGWLFNSDYGVDNNSLLKKSASWLYDKQESAVTSKDIRSAAWGGAAAVAAIVVTVITGGMGAAAFIPALGGTSAGIGAVAAAGFATFTSSLSMALSVSASALVTAYFASQAAMNAAQAYQKGDWLSFGLNLAAGVLSIAFPMRIGGASKATSFALQSGVTTLAEARTVVNFYNSAVKLQKAAEAAGGIVSAFMPEYQAFAKALESAEALGLKNLGQTITKFGLSANAIEASFGVSSVSGAAKTIQSVQNTANLSKNLSWGANIGQRGANFGRSIWGNLGVLEDGIIQGQSGFLGSLRNIQTLALPFT
ncbi:MAG: hypothetical protein FWC57_01395, partial [Endomicrobia bacterium]|nr:hypothetical protein [Endomicrobiia bacterium]